jgi:hypothetical protein
MSMLIGTIKVWQGAALPNAAGEHRGRFFLLLGAAGAADVLYICIKKADDSYGWVTV